MKLLKIIVTAGLFFVTLSAEAFELKDCYLALHIHETVSNLDEEGDLTNASERNWDVTAVEARDFTGVEPPLVKAFKPGTDFYLTKDHQIARVYIGGVQDLSAEGRPGIYQVLRAFYRTQLGITLMPHSNRRIVRPVTDYEVFLSRPDLYDRLILQTQLNRVEFLELSGSPIVPDSYSCAGTPTDTQPSEFQGRSLLSNFDLTVEVDMGAPQQAPLMEGIYYYGDMNLDLLINEADRAQFEACLITGTNGTDACSMADINQDGLINGEDLVLFNEAVANAIAAAAAGASTGPQLENLVAYWPLNIDGTDIKGGHNFSMKNVDFSTGKHDQGANLRPVYEYDEATGPNLSDEAKLQTLDIASESPLRAAGDLTLSFWLKINVVESMYESLTLFDSTSNGNGAEGLSITYDPNTDYFQLSVSGADISVQEATINEGEWTHLAFRFGANFIEIYKNGVLAHAEDVQSLGLAITQPIRMGGSLDVSIDEVAIWKSLLTSDEVFGLSSTTGPIQSSELAPDPTPTAVPTASPTPGPTPTASPTSAPTPTPLPRSEPANSALTFNVPQSSHLMHYISFDSNYKDVVTNRETTHSKVTIKKGGLQGRNAAFFDGEAALNDSSAGDPQVSLDGLSINASTGVTYSLWFMRGEHAASSDLTLISGNDFALVVIFGGSNGSVFIDVAGAILSVPAEFNDTGWNHIALVMHDGVASIYLNGTELDSEADGGEPITAPTGPINYLNVGSGYINSYDGLIDEVAVWNVALSTGDLATVRNESEPYVIRNPLSIAEGVPSPEDFYLYLPFDSNFKDILGNSDTSHSSVTINDGGRQGRKAALFESSGGEASSVSLGGLSMNASTGLTYSLWFNGMGGGHIANFDNVVTLISGNGFELGVNFSSGNVIFDGAGTTLEANADLSDTGWNHIALVMHEGVANIYLNGTGLDSVSGESIGAPTGIISFLTLGYGSAESYGGLIDEVAVWTVALSTQELSDARIFSGPLATRDDDDSIDITLYQDLDGDGLDGFQEIVVGTDPNNYDTDGDEISDGQEVNVDLTNPLDCSDNANSYCPSDEFDGSDTLIDEYVDEDPMDP